jgi:hypothetical protein
MLVLRVRGKFVALITCVVGMSGVGEAQQAPAHAGLEGQEAIFQTGDRCIACHSNLVAPSGADVSIGYAWRASMMANSARDPYWRAAVRREVMDHPQAQAEIEDTCATCHMPMARFQSARRGAPARVFPQAGGADDDPAHKALAQDGVSCTVCHQIRGDNFGTADSFTGGFVIGTGDAPRPREMFGPFDVDRGRQSVMRSATHSVPTEATHIQQSEMCATCHTLYTDALNEAGERVGRLPEQVPYLEWKHSEFRTTRSCQSCHMPSLTDETPISSVLGQPRAGFSQHAFDGGNAFMLRILNKHRDDLAVAALPQELEAAAQRTTQFLATQTARIEIDFVRRSDSILDVRVSVENLSGHKLPTAYPSRRAWLHLTVRDARGRVIFDSGGLRTDGSIVGNENDANAGQYEPHYDRIENPGQVQIYESIMVDDKGRVTTGLLYGVRYAKDNRLLPRGFNKATARTDFSVQGQAVEDANFQGGRDDVQYVIDVKTAEGPFTVNAELLFQTVGYRWAHNLKAYDAFETRQFVSYYEEAAADSAAPLGSDAATVITQ